MEKSDAQNMNKPDSWPSVDGVQLGISPAVGEARFTRVDPAPETEVEENWIERKVIAPAQHFTGVAKPDPAKPARREKTTRGYLRRERKSHDHAHSS